MEPPDNEDWFRLPSGVVAGSPHAFRIGLTLGAAVSVAAGAVLLSWAEVTFPEGGLIIAGAAFVALGFVTASVAGSRRAWAGMLCGAVLPALAATVLVVLLLPDPTGFYSILGLALPVLALGSALVLGSFGFGLKLMVWPQAGGFHGLPLVVAVAGVALGLVAIGTARGDLRWGGLFHSCPEGRSCIYEVGLSVVVPSGWHVTSPAHGEILWAMARDASPEQVGVMVKRGVSELVDGSPLPTTLDGLEARVVAQTSGASLLLEGNSTATAARMTLPVGEATCLRYERWMFLVDWTPQIEDCWFFVDDTIVLVSSVGAPSDDVDTFLRSMQALPSDTSGT